jgi:hypothetical protein
VTRWLALRGVVALLGLPFALSSRQAQAAPGDATRLEFARAADAVTCPDRDALRAAVTKRLGYDPFFPVARQAVAVEIVARGHRLVANMRLVDDDGIIQGSRELSDELGNCDELVASLALAISIALDPSAALGDTPVAPPEPAPLPEAPAIDEAKENASTTKDPTTKAPFSNAASSSASRPGPRREAAWVFRAAPTLSFGQLPNTAVGARLGVGLRRQGAEIAAEVSAWLPAARTSARGGQVQASLIAASLTPCYGAARFALCVIASLGQLRAEGRDLPTGTHDHSLYGALGVRLEVKQALTRSVALFLSADASKVVTPITFRLHEQTVWSSPAVAVVTALGVSLAIP